MTDNDQYIPGDPAPRDPWAPPDESAPKVALGKPQQAPVPPQQGQAAQGQAAPVHEQETLIDGRVGGSFAPLDGGIGAGPGPVSGPGPVPGPLPGPGDAVPPVPPAPDGPALGYGGLPPYPETSGAAGHGYSGYGYPGYGWPGMPVQPRNGMGIAAMVLGILSVCLFCLYGVVSIVLGILAIIFGVLGRKLVRRGEATNSGMAITGIITGIVGIVLGIVVVGLMIWGFSSLSEYEDTGDNDPYSTSLIVGSDS
ncbi:DUF4190 domain-containing protein [Streptomyces sp. NPDC002896]|uniref:DUF4190 domain-containing protein n=1 Tax=Streptomyces sp. NPDC002896 TaxID=3154438 RepID=UPI0033240D61